jgi:hypothetical protein
VGDFATSGYPPMIGRRLTAAEWRAYVGDYDFGPIPPTRLVLHHTYRPNEAQWRGLASMRGMQRYYASLGWSAAPHIYAGPDGIWLFTPMSDVGIHAGLGNSGVTNGVWWYSIGLEMVGYFDYARPQGNVWEYAKTVMGTISQRLGIAPRQLISFHRDYTNQKSCPGWAVTKEWVLNEVEAWLNNSAPPQPPQAGAIGNPSPIDELLMDRLINESYARRSIGYNANWAFHQYAVQHNMGVPLANSERISVDGKEYSYQPFARDTLYSEVPRWGEVQLLSELLGGSIPPGGLGRVLLEASYRAGGATFHANWAFHQYAISSNLGPALGSSGTFTLDGVEYSFQVFGGDTLYNRVPAWTDIHQLSRLASTSDPARQRMREKLLELTYQRGGATYNPGWSFHQLARKWSIGAPLGDPYAVDIEGILYNVQVYTLDTIYNVIPHWQDVQRLSNLVASQFGGGTSRSLFALGQDIADTDASTSAAPPDEQDYSVLQYTHTPPPAAFSSRRGARVVMIILHGDPGPAAETLEQMADFSSVASTHYYLRTDGRIFQMIREQYAAWHAGMVGYRGRRINLDRISIGIVLERPPGKPADSADYERQRASLGWLIRDIARRYQLMPAALNRWRSLAPGSQHAHSRQILDDITLETVIDW